MPLILPNLDDVTWSQLSEDARSQIPAYAPTWTNFNASDPGITMVELLAYFTEQLLYRVNRIGDQQTTEYLRLLNWPEWKRSKPLDAERRDAIVRLQTLQRAVTAHDFEALTLAWNKQSRGLEHEQVARAKCLPERNMEDPDPAARTHAASGHVSIVVVLKRRVTPSVALLKRMKQALDPARLLTMRVHVVAARFVTVSVRFNLVLRSGAAMGQVRSAALKRLEEFFDPLRGGTEEKGWPFGRSVYVSDVYRLLSNIPGVDYVGRRKDPATGHELDELMVGKNLEGRIKRNSFGELEAIDLEPDELPALWITPDDLALEVR